MTQTGPSQAGLLLAPDIGTFGDWQKQAVSLPSKPLCLAKQKQLWSCLTSHWGKQAPRWWPLLAKPGLLMAQRLSATFVLCSKAWCVSGSQDWLQGHTGPDRPISIDFKCRTAAGEGSLHTHCRDLNTFLEQYRSQVMHLPLEVLISLEWPYSLLDFLLLYLGFSNICLNLGSIKFYMYI